MLVLTGISTRADVERFPYRPSRIVDSIADLEIDLGLGGLADTGPGSYQLRAFGATCWILPLTDPTGKSTNLTSPTLAEVIDQAHKGTERVRRSPHLA